MVEKVLPSFQEEVMGMEFQDCIAFGKEISYKVSQASAFVPQLVVFPSWD